MAKSFIIQPGDFLINTATYSGGETMAIFEGKPIMPSYSTAKPDYSLLTYYESKPYSYSSYQKANMPDGSFLEVATPTKPCAHKIYVIENPTTWRLCTPDEKKRFIDTLESYGYHWSEKNHTLTDLHTGQVMEILTPKIQYNGQPIKIQSENITDVLAQICKTEAEKIYMYQPPVYQAPSNVAPAYVYR